jgi:hydrogenase maturation protein HypF
MLAPPSADVLLARRTVRVRGGVQGVGFRPFVFTLATRYGLSGLVGNDSDGVFVEIEGTLDAIGSFLAALRTEAPPLARIESVDVQPRLTTGALGFTIVESRHQPGAVTPVAPDVATCADCLRELYDPSDRRYRYPFINCTNCGPRYSIVTALPYDRVRTTMSAFEMCANCKAEYTDPQHRRYHAQPNACPACGPHLSWCDGTSGVFERRGDRALAAAQTVLTNDGIVAVQGIGGFHLACRADSDAAVALLRTRKQRPHKPLAVLVRTLREARALATVSVDEAALLMSPAHPIVLLDRRDDAALSSGVAPGQSKVGVMLAYSPLHHLLAEGGPLVMTSGNRAEEPICIATSDALERFVSLADGMLVHDRPIHAAADDSVMRIALGTELPIRRSRGYAPYPVALPHAIPAVLAVGGELKSTVCLTRGARAFLSPHIGDVENLETEHAMTRAVSHLQHLFAQQPTIVAADLSPVYRSTVWASRFAAERGLVLRRVQHHHAHVASLMVEHGMAGDEPVLGVAFDGTGYGTDGTVWGGEFLLADYHGFSRVAHFAPVQLAGADAAVRHPSRIALAHLHAAGVPWSESLAPVRAESPETVRVLRQQLTDGFRTHHTTSAGRWLDACAALCDVRQTVTYEGQAAIEFESLALRAPTLASGRYSLPIQSFHEQPLQVITAHLWQQMIDDMAQGRDVRTIAFDIHSALATAIVTVAERVREVRGVSTVGLTGGVFQNVLLLTLTARRLRDRHFDVLTHRQVPPNDGGLALGQAMIAGMMVPA